MKIRYVATTDTPTNADELDDLTRHLNQLTSHHEIGLNAVALDMGGEITQLEFEVEVGA